ncbi:MAG: D-glycero-beta-D-manno-heptose 1-phosphate adenylyltransferase [Candidatus Kapaibacterium sp.]
MIVHRSDISAVCDAARVDDLRIVFTNGCFDILHAGHADYLARARAHGDLLVVGLNSDSSVRRLKGASRPVNTERERALVLDALRVVDMVVVFDEDTPLELIQEVRPDVLVKGGDYTEETVVGAEFVRSRGGDVALIPFVHETSTSSIISRAASDRGMAPRNISAVHWFEIPTTDFERAVHFYETLFDRTLRRMELPGAMEPIPMAVFPSEGNGATGALVRIKEHTPATAGPLLYLNADPDLAPVLARVETAGGTVIMGKSELPNSFGFMAIFIDSEGNHMALHSTI